MNQKAAHILKYTILVIFDSVHVLHPLGYIIDDRDTTSDDSSLNKIKDRMRSIFKKNK
jgi:hypothetical protein